MQGKKLESQMRKVGFYLTAEQAEWIRKAAFNRRQTQSEFVRTLLDKVIKLGEK